MSAAPLSSPEFAALIDALGGFEARPLVAVAVSGGPDSMALMLLADRWARQRGGQAWGLTVDHGLRPESAAEAQQVRGWLAARGIAHAILVWAGDKPASGIQEAAREARYRLLAAWCRARGCLHLLTAHHREDQVETHLIRRRAGSGVDGLAGMPAIRELSGCRLVRPLLSVPRARLAALLAAEGQPWLSDPSNLNPAFERVRLRFERGVIPGLREAPSPQSILHNPAFTDAGSAAAARPGTTDEVIALARACGLRRIAREQALDALVGRAVAPHPAGFAAIDRALLAAADADTAERLLGRIAVCIGRAGYPARRARLARLRAGLVADPGRARTLGGCRFAPWRGAILVMRELAAASLPAPVEPGAELTWDGRFAVALPATAAGPVTLGYLGQYEGATPERDDSRPPRLVHPVLPALWDARGIVAVPHLAYRRIGSDPPPSLAFRPAIALSRAGFTVV